MKTQERRHLKENDLARWLRLTIDYVAGNSRQLGMIAGAVVLIAVIVWGVMAFRQRSSSDAEAALAEALVVLNAQVTPPTAPEDVDLPAAAQLGAEGTFRTEAAKLQVAIPKLRHAADTYPDQEAGIVARYHLAGALAALGQTEEAIKEFSEVVKRAPADSVYGRMARLGQADTQVRAGQYDAAIAAWKQLASENIEDLPADAILLELARAYVAKGDTTEARKVFTQLLDEHPTSPYSTEARAELDSLKG
jgi:tetratricopeptide (TPR) repeat protein